MTSPFARIRILPGCIALIALLPALFPGAAWAQGPGQSPIDQLMREAPPKDRATSRQDRPASPDVSARTPHAVTGDGQIGTAPPPARHEPLVENAWDFTDPDSIPGFSSVPFPKPGQ